MLNETQRDIIKATVPLLETGGEQLTDHFYKLMLRKYPQVRPLFNKAHQASGSQQRALANGILMYARNIDKLDALDSMARRIVNKHVSLQVQPEHYPIVGTCLLQAIREVLGPDVATDEVISAWDAAYHQLADLLIDAETDVYDSIASRPGGWNGAREFYVANKVPESEEITSFYLKPIDGRPILDFEPGQYIGLQLVVNGEEIRRNYSLSAVSNGHSYRISVKREHGGVASNFLHDFVTEGDKLHLFPPAGEFTLTKSDRPLVFISAGVGITPTLAMAEEALASGRSVTFIHYARNAAVHAFGDLIDKWTALYPQLKTYLVYENDAASTLRQPDAVGRPNMDHLQLWLPDNSNFDAYFLGPRPFMAFIKKALSGLGVPDDRSRYEFFGPAEDLD